MSSEFFEVVSPSPSFEPELLLKIHEYDPILSSVDDVIIGKISETPITREYCLSRNPWENILETSEDSKLWPMYYRLWHLEYVDSGTSKNSELSPHI